MTIDIDRLVEGGAPGFKFDDIGTTAEGVVTRVEAKQQTDVDTGVGKTWSDGSPVMQLVVTLLCEDGEERSLYAKGGKYEAATGEGKSMLEAIKDALAAAGIKASTLTGHKLAVKHSGLGKKTKAAYSAPKLYKAKVTLLEQTPAIDVDDF